MATTETQTMDLAQAIVDVLNEIDGLRAYAYVADTVRPPAVVVAQPSVDYLDNLSGFCSATWTFPLTLVVGRNNDRDAQVALSGFLQQVTSTLAAADVPGVAEIEPVSANPITVSVSGVEQPGYSIDVRVRA